MLNQFAVEIPALPVDQCYFLHIRSMKGCWGLHSYRRAEKKGGQAFGTHMVYRKTFLQIHLHLHQLLIHKNCTNGIHRSRSRFICLQRRKVEDQSKTQIWDASPDRQPKIQSSSVEETLQRIMEQTNNDCRSQIFILTNSPTPATFACWKIRFKTEVCTFSQFPTEAMQWIKEVELVDSVDDLRSSSSTRGISMPNFEVLDARIASTLNKIFHNSYFQRRISLEEQKGPKAGPFPSWQADCLLDLRSLPGHWNPWFCRKLHRPIHYCSSKWRYSGIRFKVGWNIIVHDENPTWWNLGRIVQIENTRVWETQDRIGIVRPGDSSKEVRTWLSQIESYGEKKYAAGDPQPKPVTGNQKRKRGKMRKNGSRMHVSSSLGHHVHATAAPAAFAAAFAALLLLLLAFDHAFAVVFTYLLLFLWCFRCCAAAFAAFLLIFLLLSLLCCCFCFFAAAFVAAFTTFDALLLLLLLLCCCCCCFCCSACAFASFLLLFLLLFLLCSCFSFFAVVFSAFAAASPQRASSGACVPRASATQHVLMCFSSFGPVRQYCRRRTVHPPPWAPWARLASVAGAPEPRGDSHVAPATIWRQACQHRTAAWRAGTFCEMVNVHVCNIGISCIHGKALLRQL